MGLNHGDNDPEQLEREARLASLNDDYLRSCVDIDPLRINDEYIRIPGDLAYWNQQYADALRVFLQAKVDLGTIRAKLQPAIRQALLVAGGKTTESQVEAAIDSNQTYIDAQNALIDAEVAKNEQYGKLDAIRSKKEMLVSLGAQLRAELEGDPSLREQHRGARNGG